MNKIDISNFDKSKLKISIPSQNRDGQFSKLTYDNFPIIVQTPQSLTKQGIVKNGKKIICDLMFKTMETEFLNWFEELESATQTMLHEKSNDWFEQKLELIDIENLFTTPIKLFKSGKYYLIRSFLKEPIKIFKENDSVLDLTYLDITTESNIISLLEVKGIKYTNKDFQFDIEIRQIMIVSANPFLENCFIKIKKMDGEVKENDNEVNLGNRILDNFDMDNMVNSMLDKEIKINIDDNADNDRNIVSIDNIDINNIQLEEPLEDPHIKEVILEDLKIDDDSIKITTEEDYSDIYLKAKKEANEAKDKAIAAYLKLEEIRLKYNIDESDEENL